MEAPQSDSAETTLLNATTEATGELAISTPVDNDNDDDDNQVVTPWEVTGTANYAKVVDEFGCKHIDAALVDRIARLTSSPPHRFLRRGIFFAHRDLNQLLDAYERGEKFYLYTGRGPSSKSMHLGHLVPFMFTKYLQDVFKVPVVIQLTDDEKFLWKGIPIPETKRLARENAKDIIACGFDLERTFIFQDFKYVGGNFFENMMHIGSRVTMNTAAPSFASSFPRLFGDDSKLRCLIPCAVDQDPYFRMTRDVAPKMGYHKPSLIESKFLPALQGENGKMSASDPKTAIYLMDKPDVIKKKIMKDAFSGGQDTIELQRKNGANIDVDVSIKYLNFFLEDDAKFEHIKEEYKAGKKLTGELKNLVIEELLKITSTHQRARAQVTEEVGDAFMSVSSRPNMFD